MFDESLFLRSPLLQDEDLLPRNRCWTPGTLSLENTSLDFTNQRFGSRTQSWSAWYSKAYCILPHRSPAIRAQHLELASLPQMFLQMLSSRPAFLSEVFERSQCNTQPKLEDHSFTDWYPVCCTKLWSRAILLPQGFKMTIRTGRNSLRCPLKCSLCASVHLWLRLAPDCLNSR